MNSDFCTDRTKRLLNRGYPVEVNIFHYMADGTSSLQWYLHEEIEFLYILDGQIRIACDENCLTASRGDIVFINHLIRHSAATLENHEASLCSILFHPSFLLGSDQAALAAKYLHPVLAHSAPACLLIDCNHTAYPQFQALILQLNELNSTQSPGYELLSKSCILQLWKLVYDMLPVCTNDDNRLPSHSKSLDEQRVKQAVTYIQNHFMEPVTLDHIADSIPVSKSECCRCFQRSMGMSPFAYLMKYRIEESTRRMRLRPQASISEIAGSVGFNNTSYYNKVFKKFMGCTPTEYRKSLRGS